MQISIQKRKSWIILLLISAAGTITLSIFLIKGSSPEIIPDIAPTFDLKLIDQYSTNPPINGEHVEKFVDKIAFEEPLDPRIQVHILEPHSPNSHQPVAQELKQAGVLLQYNCDQCEKLAEDLVRIALDYKPAVYVAPWPYMDDKIALTSFNSIATLEEFDESRIRAFIDESLTRYQDYVTCLGQGNERIECAKTNGYIN